MKNLLSELREAAEFLQISCKCYANLRPATRALQRLAHNLERPLRIAILGESNSGKSTIANRIAGEAALPALPVANTRLPTLLIHAPAPYVEAVFASGERWAVGADSDIAGEDILRLEVGLPSEVLRNVEVLDFPGSANPLFYSDLLAVLRHNIDAAIWASVATQAWRETERLAWVGLPQRIRRRSILAVTHCDLIKSESDLVKLRARLDAVGQEYFSAVCFVAPPGAEGASPGEENLFSKIRELGDRFRDERVGKALTITRGIAGRALYQLEQRY